MDMTQARVGKQTSGTLPAVYRTQNATEKIARIEKTLFGIFVNFGVCFVGSGFILVIRRYTLVKCFLVFQGKISKTR